MLYDEQSSAATKQVGLSDRSDRHSQLSPKTARPEPLQSQNKVPKEVTLSRAGAVDRSDKTIWTAC